MEKKKIIITGVSGFIGSSLVSYLSKINKFKLIGIDKEKPHKITKQLLDKFYLMDITKDLPNEENVYGVIHLAAKAGVRESNRLFRDYLINNVIGTKNILDKCINTWKPERCLITSSSSVYGDTDFPESPKSPYALTKLYTEEILRMYIRLGLIDDNNYTIVRPFTVYGPSLRPRKEMVIYRFIDAALSNKSIEIYGSGLQERDFTYIDDLCKALYLLIDTKEDYFDEYDIGTTDSYSLFDVAGIISNILQKDIKMEFKPANIYDVERTRANVGNLWETTGFIPSTTLRDGIKKTISWFMQKQSQTP